MGMIQSNQGDSTVEKSTKCGLAHQIPPDLSVRHTRQVRGQMSKRVGQHSRAEQFRIVCCLDAWEVGGVYSLKLYA